MSSRIISLSVGLGNGGHCAVSTTDSLAFPEIAGSLEALVEGDGIITAEDGDPIALWPDQGPHGRDLTQEVESLRPQWVAESIGGRPAVRFDGIDDKMLGWTVSLTNVQVFCVLQQHSPAWDLILGAIASAVPQFSLNHYDQGRIAFWNGHNEVLIPTPSDLTVPILITWQRFGGEAMIRLNGSEVASIAELSGDVVINGVVGQSALPAAGVFLSAVVVVDSDSPSDTAAIEAWLDRKYFGGSLGL